uniref:Uncharacterized protein n=1 Tax=viral metagenome TaxID=1070528 RepID=A0A6M3MH13_9ZZZZ
MNKILEKCDVIKNQCISDDGEMQDFVMFGFNANFKLLISQKQMEEIIPMSSEEIKKKYEKQFYEIFEKIFNVEIKQ